MAKDIELNLRLAMVDKVTGILGRVNKTSLETAKGLKTTRDNLKLLNTQLGQVDNLKKQQAALAQQGTALKVLRTNLDSVTRTYGANSVQAGKLQGQVNKATAAYEKQRGALVQLRTAATASGIGKLSTSEATLRASIAKTTAEITKQTDALRKRGAMQRRSAEMRDRHQKAMGGLGAMAGAGAAGVATGYAVGRPVVATMQAFGDQETAAMQLRASMMTADGSVPAELKEISRLAQQLGDRLPGTTADFYELMTVLKKEGMSNKAILGGLGESAAYLAVQLQLPIDQAGKFAAQMQDATRATEGEMMGLMDVIQRTFYLGVDSDQMLGGFAKLSGTLGTLRKTGVDAAKTLAPLLVMMNQSGMNDGASAGNAIRKVIDAGLNSKRMGKANNLLDKQGAGFKLNFADKKGQFAGLDNVFEQLKKIKGIQNVMARNDVMRELFGDDGETHQVLGVMMDKGIDGYREVVAKMQAQADLRKRVNEQLTTLKNVMEAAQGVGVNLLASIGETVAPQLKILAEWLGRVGVSLGAWVTENPRLVAGLTMAAAALAIIAGGFGALAIALAGFFGPMLVTRFILSRVAMAMAPLAGPILGGLIAGFKAAGSAILFIGRALLMTPIGLLVTGIAVAAMLIYKYWGPISSFFARMWAAVTSGLATAGTWIRSTFDSVMAYLGTLPARFLQFGADMMTGMVNGIIGKVSAVRDAIGGAADSAIGWFRDKLGIRSPSRVFMESGTHIVQGAAQGIDRTLPMLRAAALGMAGATAVAMPAMSASIDTRAPLTAAGARGGGATTVQGDTITINITAAAGTDANGLAGAIRAELDRRDAAKNARMRAAFTDYDN